MEQTKTTTATTFKEIIEDFEELFETISDNVDDTKDIENDTFVNALETFNAVILAILPNLYFARLNDFPSVMIFDNAKDRDDFVNEEETARRSIGYQEAMEIINPNDDILRPDDFITQDVINSDFVYFEQRWNIKYKGANAFSR